jgi:endonuclease III
LPPDFEKENLLATRTALPRRPPVSTVVKELAKVYGQPQPSIPADPYEMALRESVAYLVDDERRERTFVALRRTIGIAPQALLQAGTARIAEAIQDGGMRPLARAAKVIECARLTQEIGLARLREVCRRDPATARKLLKAFPGFGEPGVEKMLLFSGSLVSLAPDSNALRVLLRLGFGFTRRNYGQTYRDVRDAVADELPKDSEWLASAHLLLRRHGRETCRRKAPECDRCAIASRCRAFASGSFSV